MAKKQERKGKAGELERLTAGRPSALVDTQVVYCGDNLEQLRLLPEGCVDLVYIDPPFNSNGLIHHEKRRNNQQELGANLKYK